MSRAKLTDPDLPLEELMTLWPGTVAVFVRHKMLCVGCLVAPFHTVSDACREYGLNEEVFLLELLQAAQLV